MACIGVDHAAPQSPAQASHSVLCSRAVVPSHTLSRLSLQPNAGTLSQGKLSSTCALYLIPSLLLENAVSWRLQRHLSPSSHPATPPAGPTALEPHLSYFLRGPQKPAIASSSLLPRLSLTPSYLLTSPEIIRNNCPQPCSPALTHPAAPTAVLGWTPPVLHCSRRSGVGAGSLEHSLDSACPYPATLPRLAWTENGPSRKSLLVPDAPSGGLTCTRPPDHRQSLPSPEDAKRAHRALASFLRVFFRFSR